MSAVVALGVEEMGMVARHRDTLLVVGHPEAGQRASHVGESQLLLVFGGLGEGSVGPVLLGYRAGANHAEIAGNTNGDDQVGARQRLIDARSELGTVDRRRHVETTVGGEPSDD